TRSRTSTGTTSRPRSPTTRLYVPLRLQNTTAVTAVEPARPGFPSPPQSLAFIAWRATSDGERRSGRGVVDPRGRDVLGVPARPVGEQELAANQEMVRLRPSPRATSGPQPINSVASEMSG